MDLATELKKKSVEHVGNGDTNCSWCTWNGAQILGKKLEEVEIRGRIVAI